MNTDKYKPIESPVHIQPGDSGFALVKSKYNRFIWTFAEWKKSKFK